MSELKVNKVTPRSGTTVTLGDSGDTITIPSGATLDASNATLTLPDGSVTSAKISYPLTTFSSTGIDDDGTSTAITINSSNNVALAGNIGLGGATPTTSGTGITFPATASASTNANTLDDYEEGTVTATMAPQTSGSLPLNASIQTLGYTKIGRLVTITGLLRLATPSSPVGIFISVDNLPFVVASSVTITLYGARGGSGVSFLDSGTGNYSVLPIEFSESESRFLIRVDASTLAANDDFRISLSYFSD